MKPTEQTVVDGRASFRSILIPVLALLLLSTTLVLAAQDDRTITSIATTPDNTFDNLLTTTGSDSGVYISVNLSGAGVAEENTDSQGGYRVEFYNGSGQLIRRRASQELRSNPSSIIRWNGQGDSHVNDTQAYGSYTMRTYVSMRNPTIAATIQGNGLTIDRPGDLHVTSGGLLTWMNTGTRLSFCQASIGNPAASNPTFTRLVDLPTGLQGATNTDRNFGVVMNSTNFVFVVADTATGVQIGKYNTATETWTNQSWATQATTTLAEDEWVGLGIDSQDSIYVATATGLVGGGVGPGGNPPEFIAKFKDNGTTATQDTTTADQASDMYDVGALVPWRQYIINGIKDTGGWCYAVDQGAGTVDSFGINPRERDPIVAFGAGGSGKSIWVLADSTFYVTNDARDSFGKYTHTGTLKYAVNDARIDGASGIAVWQKTTTGETFVIVGAQTSNQIVIYQENAAGDTATFVRTVADDDNNLSTPVGLGVDADSSIIVVNRGSRSVKRFTKDGVFQSMGGAANGKYITGIDGTSTLTDTQGFNTPGAVAVDSLGYIYVFDQEAGFAGDACIKRFSPSGVPDSVVFLDLDVAIGASGAFGDEIMSAVYANNSIYAVSRANAARLFRVGIASKTVTIASVASDLLSVAIGPYADTPNATWRPGVVYVYTTTDVVRIYSDTLGFQIGGNFTPSNPATAASANVPQPMLVDEFGDLYLMIDPGAAPYEFRRYTGGNAEAPLAGFGLLDNDYGQGSGATQFNAPRQMVWTDNRGSFAYNPVSGRYERKIWINDSNNNRLHQLLLDWSEVEDSPIIITQAQDTPIVVSATVTGDTVTTFNGTTYIGVCTPTFQLNFNNTVAPETAATVTIFFNGGGSATVSQTAYAGTTWSGTVQILATHNEGTGQIQVENASDVGGTIHLISPNPDRTDNDAGDDFKPFELDRSAPTFSVAAPASGGVATSEGTYTVSGQITTEATGLDCSVLIENWTDSLAGSVYDSISVTANGGTGNFSGVIDLQGPSPTDNYIQVTPVDRLNHRATLGTRRYVRRERNVGSGQISPSSAVQVSTLRRYELKYTAAQSLSGDSLRFSIPADWNTPVDDPGSTNGFFTISTTGSYGDSSISGNTILCTGVTLGIGGTLTINYGDSSLSSNGRAAPGVDAPLDDASNTFGVQFQQMGDTSFTNVPNAGGQTLIVSVVDSDAYIAVHDTAPKSDLAVIGKGEETTVMVVRVKNNNVGNHTHRISSMVFSVESDTGGSIPWLNVASRLKVKNTSEGTTFADISTFPNSASLTITPTNFTVGQGLTRDMEFVITFSPTATADTVRFYFSGTGAFTAVDSNSAKVLSVLELDTGIVNKKTGRFDLIGYAPADTISVGGDTSGTTTEVATGQKSVTMLDLQLLNEAPSVDTPVNAVAIDRVTLRTQTAAGASLAPSHAIAAIYLRNSASQTLYGSLTGAQVNAYGDTLQIDLSGLSLSISSGESVTVRVSVDIATDTQSVSQFRLSLPDTSSIIARDKITNEYINVRDNPARSESLAFRTDTITIVPQSRANLRALTLVNADSSVMAYAGSLVRGNLFYVGLNYFDSSGSSPLRVIPGDSDLRFFIDGTNRTSEFSVTAEGARTVSAGGEDTFFYRVVQDLGSTTGSLRVDASDTTSDTRPRVFDNHDYSEPDKLRALLTAFYPDDSVTITAAALSAAAQVLDTTYANTNETAVPRMKVVITNSSAGTLDLDTVTVEGLSCGLPVTKVRVYHDNRNGALQIHTDSQVGTGMLGTSTDSVLIDLDARISIGPMGDTALIFVTFDFETTALTDNDTFDCRIPALGLCAVGQDPFPSASPLTDTGQGRVEIVARFITITPDSQIVAVNASPNITLKAVDAYGNIDNTANAETTTQGHNIQVDLTLINVGTDTTHHITGASGMTNVTPSPAIGVRSINGKLSSGQGTITFNDTAAETVTISLSSTLVDSTGMIQFASLFTVSAVSLSSADSGLPDSRAYQVLKFRATNSSGMNDSLTQVGITSLNTADTDVTAVILFQDKNGNSEIDSGTDTLLATGNFSNGTVSFTGLSVWVPNNDSVLLMVGYNVNSTLVADRDALDARADTVNAQGAGALVTTAPNSSPSRRANVIANRIDFSPTSGGPIGLNQTFTVTATAVDAYGNRDLDYVGGTPTKLEFDLTGSAQFTAASTLASEELPVSGDYTKIRGYLASGQADLVFSDATEETSSLSVSIAPNLSGTNDTGTFVWQNGYLVSDSALGFASVSPGDTNRIILAFKVTATGSSDSVTSCTIVWLGTSTNSCTNLRLYKDNGDERFTSADTYFGLTNPGFFTAETVTFAGDTVYVADGSSKIFFFVVDVRNTASNGDTLDAGLRDSQVRTVGLIASLPSSLKNSSGHETVVVVAPPPTSISFESVAVTSQDVAKGAQDVVVGRFRIINSTASVATCTSVTIQNSGALADTGITNVEVWLDTQPDGTVDSAFGTAGPFSSGSRTFTGAIAIGASDTIDLIVRFDLADTISSESKSLDVQVNTYGLTISGDTAPDTAPLNSVGNVYVFTAIWDTATDSFLIAAGAGIANGVDTAVISVSVRDTTGAPVSYQSVTINGQISNLTFAANPVLTDSNGIALFSVRTETSGNYTISGNVGDSPIGDSVILSFIAHNYASGDNLGGNANANILQKTVTGSGKHYLGNVVFDGPNKLTYFRADGSFWQLVQQTVDGGETVLLSRNAQAGHETGQINNIGSLQIARTLTTLSGSVKEYAIVGIVHRANGRRSQIYAVDLTTGDSVRIMPNNPASVAGNPFTNTAWRFFSMAPNGETVVAVQDGDLVTFFRASGSAWNNANDSGRIRQLSAQNNAFGIGGFDATNRKSYLAYPCYSPDGNRIALSAISVSDNFANGPAVDSASIYVLKNLNQLVLGGYPTFTVTSLSTTQDTRYFVPVATNDSFAYNPRWTQNGDGIIYTSARGPGFDWQDFFTDSPNFSGFFDTTKLVTRFVYYDKDSELAPYPPIDISNENGTSARDIAMANSGTQRLAYIRGSMSGATRTHQIRTVDLQSISTISTQGGVLFDSGRVLVIVPASDSYGTGFRIASRTPDSTPVGNDSTIITGGAKKFFSPDKPDSPIFFADSISIILYYTATDFTETELIGFDSDGDGIPDRTEAAVSAYYWTGTQWLDYNAVKYPNENKIEFKTTHFSLYGMGVPGLARALAFNGSVQEIVAYPNPWRIDGPTSGLSASDPAYGLKFTNFPGGDVKIRIYTIAGEKLLDETVNGLTNASTSAHLRVTGIINNVTRGTVSWDLRNRAGREVASGIYIILFDGPGGRAARKVAVIR